MSGHLSNFAIDHLMPVNIKPDLLFVRGEGSYLYDHTGKRYLDWVQGWAVNCLGHSPEVLVEAIVSQARALINPSPGFYNPASLELAGLLARHSCFDQVFFGSTGAEANEGAIKLARKWGQVHKHGAYEIITFHQGFHGRTLATMSASGKSGWENLFKPHLEGFRKAELNHLGSVAALISDQTVAIMLEPIQGEAGVIPADVDFMQGIRRLCDQHQLLLIVDEVQTGCGRTGRLFAYEHFGIEPDIMTLGKGLGGGIPLSALLAKRSACCFQPGDQGGTFSGNPVTCAAGVAVMQALTAPRFLQQVTSIGTLLAKELQSLRTLFALGTHRGRGLLHALETGSMMAPSIVDACRENGLLLNAARPHCLRFMPALNSTEDEILEGIQILRKTLTTINA